MRFRRAPLVIAKSFAIPKTVAATLIAASLMLPWATCGREGAPEGFSGGTVGPLPLAVFLLWPAFAAAAQWRLRPPRFVLFLELAACGISWLSIHVALFSTILVSNGRRLYGSYIAEAGVLLYLVIVVWQLAVCTRLRREKRGEFEEGSH